MLISTFTNLGNAETCTVSRAGKSSAKYFPYTSFISEKRFHICEKNGGLYHVAGNPYRPAAKWPFRLLHHLVSLFLQVFILNPPLEGSIQTCPEIKSMTCPDPSGLLNLYCLVVRTNWCRSIACIYDLFLQRQVNLKFSELNLALYVFFAKN